MPAAAVVAGVVGAVSTAGAAAAAVGALATAGTAALTVGSVASIATFVGSVTTVVGAVTGNNKLLKVGAILGVAGGVTSMAANSLKLFGEGQTLSAAVNAANTANAANAAYSASIAQSIPLGEFVTPKESFMAPLAGRSAGGLLTESAFIPPSTTAQAAQAAQAAQQTANSSLNLAPVVDKSLSSVTENSFTNTAGILTPTVNAPTTPSVETPGFSFQKLSEFFTDKNNYTQLMALGAAASSYGKASMEEPLIEAQTNLYNTRADIARQNMYNSSAAGRLYGATK